MNVRKLIRTPLDTGPQCCGELHWNTARYITKRTVCKRQASFLIDGRPMCSEHAGKVLLNDATKDVPSVHYQRLEAAE